MKIKEKHWSDSFKALEPLIMSNLRRSVFLNIFSFPLTRLILRTNSNFKSTFDVSRQIFIPHHPQIKEFRKGNLFEVLKLVFKLQLRIFSNAWSNRKTDYQVSIQITIETNKFDKADDCFFTALVHSYCVHSWFRIDAIERERNGFYF